MSPPVEKLLLVGSAELRARWWRSPAWSDAQKVVGVAYSPGGHLADGASHRRVVDDHRPGGPASPCPRQHGFYQGIYEHKIIPLPVSPVSWPTPSTATTRHPSSGPSPTTHRQPIPPRPSNLTMPWRGPGPERPPLQLPGWRTRSSAKAVRPDVCPLTWMVKSPGVFHLAVIDMLPPESAGMMSSPPLAGPE